MALNFPSSPTTGQTHDATNGLSYYYDGVKWTTQGTYADSSGTTTKKIDDISSDFNGVSTTFNLHHNSSDIAISSTLDILISVGGVIQEPGVAYTVNPTASTITFTGAPQTGDSFFGVLKSKLVDQNITSDQTVNTSNLSGSSVTTAKINDLAVTTAKLASNSVTSAKLDTNIDIAGTLDVTNNTVFDANVNIKGDNKTFTIEKADGTDKFTVASQTGNTTVAGTLGVTGLTTLSKGFVLPKVSSTLSSTALAVTSGWHEITASGNALTTLTGGTAGQLLLITVAGTDLVVTDTAIGGGSNTIVGGVTLDLSEGDTLLLMFDGTQWRKIAHGDN